MGLVKEEKLANGNIGLEITYGGKEAPFGGVDTSAPPAYIDPRCFTLCNGFLVIDNKLVAVNFQPAQNPTLWNGTSGVILLKIGTFYNSLNGQLNYAFGYTATPFGTVGTTPTGVAYKFYMTSWSPSAPTVPFNDTLQLRLFDASSILLQASLTLDCIGSGASSTTASNGAQISITSVSFPNKAITGYTIPAGSGTGYASGQYLQVIQIAPQGGSIIASNAIIEVTAVNGSGGITGSSLYNGGDGYYAGPAYPNNIQSATASLIINGPAGGPNTYNVPSTNAAGYTRQSIVAAMVTAINAGPDPNVVATSSIDGYSIILTAISAGVSGNSITVQDNSAASSSTVAPTFYFAAGVARNLEGGQISEPSAAPRSFVPPASTAEVGGTLYIANLGPMILKYSGPGQLTTSTMYNGVGVIRKFAGSMIGLRLENQLGTFTQNQDMIFAWTAGENLDEWSPETVTGDVTGAGFEQIADIGDYLAGLIVSNGTAFIIRAQGLSYATPTGNATLPYAISHIGLGDSGEGAQVSNLVCQYDQVGAFVGNTDIFQVAGQISSIGNKIKAALFTSLAATFNEGTVLSANACAVLLGGDVFPIVVFCAGPVDGTVFGKKQLRIYVFNVSNGTWSMVDFEAVFGSGGGQTAVGTFILDTLFSQNTFASENQYDTSSLTAALQIVNNSEVIQSTALYSLTEGIPNSLTLPNALFNPQVQFAQEEIGFGRDVTVDALFVALWANVSENVTVTFHISGLVNIAADGSPAVYAPTFITYATVTLTPAQFNTLSGLPTEIQIFAGALGAGAFTGHAPQLSYIVTPLTDTGTAQIRFSKLSMFCSYDPDQRPV